MGVAFDLGSLGQPVRAVGRMAHTRAIAREPYRAGLCRTSTRQLADGVRVGGGKLGCVPWDVIPIRISGIGAGCLGTRRGIGTMNGEARPIRWLNARRARGLAVCDIGRVAPIARCGLPLWPDPPFPLVTRSELSALRCPYARIRAQGRHPGFHSMVPPCQCNPILAKECGA